MVLYIRTSIQMHGFVCKYVGMNINQELRFPLTKTLYEYSRYQIYISEDLVYATRVCPTLLLQLLKKAMQATPRWKGSPSSLIKQQREQSL